MSPTSLLYPHYYSHSDSTKCGRSLCSTLYIISKEKKNIPEIENAIKQLKAEKAPGIEGIKNETIKWFIVIIKKPLRMIFNNMLKSKIISKQWKKQTNIMILFKKMRSLRN